MNRRRQALRTAGRAGEEIVRARAAAYLGAVAALAGGGLALLVVLILAVAGVGPALGASVLIVAGVALVAGLAARAAVRRLSVAALAAFAAGRIARRRGR